MTRLRCLLCCSGELFRLPNLRPVSGPAGLRLVHRPQQHGQRPVHGGVVPGALPDLRPGPVHLARPARQPAARPQRQHVPQRGQIQLVLHPLPRSEARARAHAWGVAPPGRGGSDADFSAGSSLAACQCNGHSKCVNESVCERCENLTSGRHCESCISGFYGDPTNGGSCQREYSLGPSQVEADASTPPASTVCLLRFFSSSFWS